MEMSSNFMPEVHVAQQSRRDKLRVPHSVVEHLDGNSNDLPASFPVATGGAPVVLPPVELMNPFSDSYAFQNTSELKQFNENQHQQQQQSSSENMMLPQFSDHYSLLPSFVSQGNETGSLPSHGLSLSLASNRIGEIRGLGDHHHHNHNHHALDPKPFESATISSVVDPIQGLAAGGSIPVYRTVGPLGPFTGYTTILRGSKFLKPAQQLLDEFLGATGLRPVRGCEEAESVCETPDRNHHSGGGVGGSSGLGLGSRACGSNGCEGEPYSRPGCHEKKAKLLHMQEEVCKRHKQYHQQMEMVMSAFESVPGLGNATPYIFRSLKIISKHFRCIKNAIANQLKLIRKALGEDLSSSTSMANCGSTSLRFAQNFSKVKAGGIAGMGYVGQQNHVWRPQRGLPERAVSVLRAWLFDHFLHPYPTDTDKQMLATQTGLSRNQVSNWFINARVRLWKPMVEEIHMLESKGASRSESNSNNSDMSPISSSRPAAGNQAGCKQAANMIRDGQFECLGSSSSMEGCRGEMSNEQMFQKRSRMDAHEIQTSVDGSLLGLLPYQRQGMEMGGIGAVSLTLGLRHSSETTQQQLQHQFQQQGLHFGSHIIHDFSG